MKGGVYLVHVPSKRLESVLCEVVAVGEEYVFRQRLAHAQKGHGLREELFHALP